jgi:flagellar biosynthesis GTPase FlhF
MATENTPAQAAELQAQAQARDLQRSHELVDLVRGEIAALRREFRLSQQSSAWQSGLQLHPSLGVLVNALNEAQVPMALRALLVDALQGQNDPHQALAVWRSQLEHSLARPQQAMPSQGLHVLAGPSGSGKTMMCARLAHHASALHGGERLALISYRDHRAGAWSQIQMLGAQLGIDCFRANDEDALRLLVGELGPRSLVLIDTPGVQMSERLAEIKAAAPQAALHAVVSADASGAALRRVLVDAGVDWQSVMLSKLDETESPWALLQIFSDNDLKLSCASGGSRMTDLMSTFTLPQLIDLALAPMLSQSTTPMASHAMLVSSDAPSFVKVALEALEPAPVAQAVVIQAVAPELVSPPAKVAKARTPRKAVATAPVTTRATRPARSSLKTQTAPTSA